jgi:hypothetical protein
VLRVLPLAPGMSEDVRWELAARGWPQQVRAGVTMSQVTALSALVTIYLHCAVAATEEEVERVLAPLASRTRVQEVLRGLHSARQIEMVGVGHGSYYALTESAAVELAAAADDRERAELAAARAAAGVAKEAARLAGDRKEWKPRERSTYARPGVAGRAGAGRPPRDGERKPWVKREGGAAGGERKPWVKREGGAAGGERKPWVKREGTAGGERKPWVKREGGAARPFVKRGPPRDGERKPFVKREGAAGGERRPWKDRPTGKAGEGSGGRERPKRAGGFAKAGERKPWVKREGAGGERKPFGKSGPGTGRSFAGKSAGKPGADRGDYKPRPKAAGGFKRGAAAGAKPWAKKSGGFKRPDGKARGGEKPPARKPRKKPEEE